jgi:hypothetical protein
MTMSRFGSQGTRASRLVVVGALVLGATWALRAQDSAAPDAAARAASRERGLKSAEIHEAVAARNVPIESVRVFPDGRMELVMGSGCTPAQEAEAESICDQILKAPRKVTEVDNVADALVVLQFEPENAAARRLVRERYEQLRQAGR